MTLFIVHSSDDVKIVISVTLTRSA